MAAEGHGLAGVCVRTRMKEACFSLAGYVEVDGVELDEALANLYVAHINLVLCVGNVLVFVLSLITSNSIGGHIASCIVAEAMAYTTCHRYTCA
jgi:hypothetical protein